ncbi:unnamed protein product [Closterium sp. Yama58-4]|nr:unnamed protein product [Closterium sp. Yama58-4]
MGAASQQQQQQQRAASSPVELGPSFPPFPSPSSVAKQRAAVTYRRADVTLRRADVTLRCADVTLGEEGCGFSLLLLPSPHFPLRAASVTHEPADITLPHAEVTISEPLCGNNDSPRPASPRPASPRPTSPRPASPRPASPRPASPRPASPRPASPRPASPRPASPRPTSPRPASPRPASPRLASPRPTSPRPASPRPAPPVPSSCTLDSLQPPRAALAPIPALPLSHEGEGKGEQGCGDVWSMGGGEKESEGCSREVMGLALPAAVAVDGVVEGHGSMSAHEYMTGDRSCQENTDAVRVQVDGMQWGSACAGEAVQAAHESGGDETSGEGRGRQTHREEGCGGQLGVSRIVEEGEGRGSGLEGCASVMHGVEGRVEGGSHTRRQQVWENRAAATCNAGVGERDADAAHGCEGGEGGIEGAVSSGVECAAAGQVGRGGVDEVKQGDPVWCGHGGAGDVAECERGSLPGEGVEAACGDGSGSAGARGAACAGQGEGGEKGGAAVMLLGPQPLPPLPAPEALSLEQWVGCGAHGWKEAPTAVV